MHHVHNGSEDALAGEELLLEILRCALQVEKPGPEPRISTRRLIQRTKEYVEWHLSRSFRLSDAARAVDASAAYLTDVFRRFEGSPLHQYAIRLRLARALVELPHTADLTMLALNLGFSSHSHFTSVFRRTFGCTPSDFRGTTRAGQKRITSAQQFKGSLTQTSP